MPHRDDLTNFFFAPLNDKFSSLLGRNGILLPKLILVRRNCSSDWEISLKFEAEGKNFKITWTIYSNCERSKQFFN